MLLRIGVWLRLTLKASETESTSERLSEEFIMGGGGSMECGKGVTRKPRVSIWTRTRVASSVDHSGLDIVPIVPALVRAFHGHFNDNGLEFSLAWAGWWSVWQYLDDRLPVQRMARVTVQCTSLSVCSAVRLHVTSQRRLLSIEQRDVFGSHSLSIHSKIICPGP